MLAAIQEAEIAALEELSARIGADPMFTQAGTGNTSVKIDGTLWIKASGKRLARARQEDLFVPVNLDGARRSVEQGLEIGGEFPNRHGARLTPSIETAMHAVLPDRVVIHAHSIHTITWAVRQDGPEELADRLGGLAWQWVRYVPSGLPLAREIEKALAGFPGANVFVLANHGLVICEECPEAAEDLLYEVDERLAAPMRQVPAPDCGRLTGMSDATWRLPQNSTLHALGTDPMSRNAVRRGTLYPCQAMFFGPSIEHQSSFRIVDDAGILVRAGMTDTETATLRGLVEVLQRIPADAPLSYLDPGEVTRIVDTDAPRYRGYTSCH